MTKMSIAAITLTIFSFSVHAENNLYSQHFNSCIDHSGGVTVEMLNCIGDEHTKQDAKLNQAYKKLTSQLAADRKKALLAAQRLWIEYRDANCTFYADPDGGTIATLNAASCALEITAQRAKELENLAE